MTKKSILPIKTLRKLLVCDAEAGKLYWRERTPDMFACGNMTPESNCKGWNTRYSGKEALTAHLVGRYKHGPILRKKFVAHRVIWALHYGEWPRDQLDHINHDGFDNRICNLRQASNAENGKNQSMHKDNTSGHCGVHWVSSRETWEAQIKVDGRRKYLGRFKRKDDAIAARNAANIKYGFHRNHGVGA